MAINFLELHTKYTKIYIYPFTRFPVSQNPPTFCQVNKVKNPCDSGSQSRGTLQFPDKEMGLAVADRAHQPRILSDFQMFYIFHDNMRKIVRQENQNNNKRKLISLQCVTYFPDSYTSVWITSKSPLPIPLHYNSLDEKLMRMGYPRRTYPVTIFKVVIRSFSFLACVLENRGARQKVMQRTCHGQAFKCARPH